MPHQHDLVRKQFGQSPSDYVKSPNHAAGEDLERLIAWAAPQPGERGLDVATGGGHVALALARLGVRVTALDLTPAMLDAAREHFTASGHPDITLTAGDAQALPCRDAAFALAACRIAPHHFPDPRRFLAEVRRVLAPGGRFLLEDTVSPPGSAGMLLHRIDSLRDPSHCRALSLDAWMAALAENGFTVMRLELFPKRHPLAAWLDRMRAPEAVRREVAGLLASAGEMERKVLRLEFEEGAPVAFSDAKALFLAE